MKTAISIPDELFLSAENTAKKLGGRIHTKSFKRENF
jgi:hypothetical protein